METPFSVLTNLAYIAAGLVILRGQEKRTGIMVGGIQTTVYRRTLASWLVGLSFVALGITSGLFHAFYEPWAQLADERGMYLAFSVLAGVLWANIKTKQWWTGEIGYTIYSRRRRQVFVVASAALGVILAASAAEPWVDSMWTMPTLAILCITGVGIGQSWGRALRFFIAFLGIAAIRELPEANFWARDPLFGYDVIHGGWHLFTALFMYYLYQSTEE